MKVKMGNDSVLREMHLKYAEGYTDEELKKWWISYQPGDVNEEDFFVPNDTHLRNMREDFSLAIKCNSVRTAENIQEWFKQQPYLPQPTLGLIHKFLWASKEDPEQCKKKLMRYYSLRGTDDELFSNRDPMSPESQQVYSSSHFMCLPGFTPEFYRISVSVLKDLHPDSFIPKEWIKRVFYIGDLRVRDDFCLGDIMIFDLKGFSLQHLLKFPITLAKKMVVASEGALPTRIKQIHMINCPSFVDKVVGLFKPFLKEKIAKRVYVHMDGLDKLYEFVPKDLLPNEYGGKAGTFEELSNVWVKEFEQNRDWFINEEKNFKRIYMEAKKEGKLFIDSGDLFGMEGSFKKLSID